MSENNEEKSKELLLLEGLIKQLAQSNVQTETMRKETSENYLKTVKVIMAGLVLCMFMTFAYLLISDFYYETTEEETVTEEIYIEDGINQSARGNGNNSISGVTIGGGK